MLGEHRFDHRCARAPVEAGDGLAADDEHERRHVLDAHLVDQIRSLVDVDVQHA